MNTRSGFFCGSL